MAAQQILRGDHNGIPVMWSQIDGTFDGSLIFGVGVQDEIPIKAGITHLVEHLVMSQVGDLATTHNAVTDAENVTFVAQGPAELVAEFLNRVGASISAIRDIAHGVVAAEVAHISAELGELNGRTGTGPFLERYGATTYGLLDLGAPAHQYLTLADVVAWADAYFHAGNAVIALSGPVPENLDIVLPPARPIPQRRTPTRLEHRRNGWLGGGQVPVALSLDLTTDNREARFAALNCLDIALFDELRTIRHLVYSVKSLTLYPEPDTAVVTYVLDPRPENILETVDAALSVLRGIADSGPAHEVFDKFQERWRVAEADSDALYSNVLGSAARWVRIGVEPMGLGQQTSQSAGPAEVRDVVSRALTSLLVSFAPIETTLTADQITDRLGLPHATDPRNFYESGKPPNSLARLRDSDMVSFSPKRSSRMKGQRLVIDAECIAWFAEGYGVHELRWDRLVLAGHCAHCGLWCLTDAHGAGMYIQAAWWRGSPMLLAKINEHVPLPNRYPLMHAGWH